MNPPRKCQRDPADDGWTDQEYRERDLEGTKADELAELLSPIR